MAVRNIKLTIAYDGSEYHGWQSQPGENTIQAALAEAIERLIGTNVRLTGASRTDAGVSALGQVALVEIDSPIPVENLAKAITHRLPPQIAVTDAIEVQPGFDVIGDVKKKLYRYTIHLGKVRPVLHIKHCWHLPFELNVTQMNQASKYLVGKKDFRSFATASDPRENSVRTIFRCDVSKENDFLYVDVEGDGFLYNMVRNIVGTLVEVGMARIHPDNMTRILEAKDRSKAGPMAPAGGLCLMWIKYC